MALAPASEAITESDVEQKIVYPLLNSNDFLGFPGPSIKTKSYLAPTQIDKAAKRGGYFPDYSIWAAGYPILVVEVKSPDIQPEVGFKEAALYARQLNSEYPHGMNPCQIIVACNGHRLIAGYWDQDAAIVDALVDDLRPGSAKLAELKKHCGLSVIEDIGRRALASTVLQRAVRPYSLVGGQALLNSKRPVNSFAAELSPVLRRYFSSSQQTDVDEIARRAYVSSDEATGYDRILESVLKDRVAARRDTIVEPIRTAKAGEPKLTKALADFDGERPPQGQLQIIQGGVGAGKSLFARRYRSVLQPEEMRDRNYWSFVDFNGGPPSLKDAQEWLAKSFIESFEIENPGLDIYDGTVLKGIFARKIQQKKAVYDQLKKVSEDEASRVRALDLGEWQSDTIGFAEGLANYIGGIKRGNLIVVMDNVDRLDLQGQLDAFQLSLWFMGRTRAFVILQMRDETYERFKNKPPLDTFRAGIAFHISPPRFTDVVKRRLELGIEYLANNSAETQEFVLDNGARFIIPSGELGLFLRSLYLELFGRRRNVARVLEALSGSDVRRALEMFVSIVTSGHLSTSTITSNVLGEGGIPLAEYHILRILMRTDYRFFHDTSGYVTNIFGFDPAWPGADNFLLCEVLYYLSINRKRQGPLGLEGYFSVAGICDEIERLGYPRDTVFKAVNYLLEKQLISAEDFNFTSVTETECVKIQASGFIHLRVLCARLEYLYGVVPVTPVTDTNTAEALASFVNAESQRGFSTLRDTAQAVAVLHKYLKFELGRLRQKNPFYNFDQSGANYVLGQMGEALSRHYHRGGPPDQNELDFT